MKKQIRRIHKCTYVWQGPQWFQIAILYNWIFLVYKYIYINRWNCATFLLHANNSNSCVCITQYVVVNLSRLRRINYVMFVPWRKIKVKIVILNKKSMFDMANMVQKQKFKMKRVRWEIIWITLFHSNFHHSISIPVHFF